MAISFGNFGSTPTPSASELYSLIYRTESTGELVKQFAEQYEKFVEREFYDGDDDETAAQQIIAVLQAAAEKIKRIERGRGWI